MGDTEHGPRLAPGRVRTTDVTEHVASVSGKNDIETGRPGVGGTDGFGGYGRSFLSDSVGRGQSNRSDDVYQASSFLAENGLLPGPTRKADEPFLLGLERGQERLSEMTGGGLSVDGVAKPWGPTEVLSQRAITSGKMKAPKPPVQETRPQLPPPHTSINGLRMPSGNQEPPPKAGKYRKFETLKRLPNGGFEANLPASMAPGARKEDQADPGKQSLTLPEREAIRSFLINLVDNSALAVEYIYRLGLPSAFMSTLKNPGEYFIKEKDKGT